MSVERDCNENYLQHEWKRTKDRLACAKSECMKRELATCYGVQRTSNGEGLADKIPLTLLCETRNALSAYLDCIEKTAYIYGVILKDD